MRSASDGDPVGPHEVKIDRERAQVYAAELAAFDGTDLEEVQPVADIVALIRRVAATIWWPGGALTVRVARIDAASSTTRCARSGDSEPVISIARPQATTATAAHELAHVLAGLSCGHDATFRRAYLDVISMITNLDRSHARGRLHVDQLRGAFASAGLTVGDRLWPEPNPSAAGPIAL